MKKRSFFGRFAILSIPLVVLVPLIILVGLLLKAPVHVRDEVYYFDIEEEWRHVCITSPYQHPDAATESAFGKECWGGTDVHPRQTNLSYDLVSGGCKRIILHGTYADASGQYTNECYSRQELGDYMLEKTNGQYYLKSKGK